MSCPTCHTQNDPSANTCANCGSVLGLRPGKVIASRYELISELGSGGMGIVFKARDRLLREDVALKVLRPEVAGTGDMARRFIDEIRLARRVTHKNVCRIHEYGEDGTLRYISMAYVDGIDVKKIIRQQRSLQWTEAFEIAVSVANGLEAIHDEGIVHRDLKTPNIMMDTRGVVRVMDFGIAKLTTDAGEGMTATGMIVGTPEYMSPEQARGARVDHRSDIYALGVVAFELFTGHVPFRGDNPVVILMKHLQEPAPLDGPESVGLPRSIVPVLRTALAKDPAQRYQTIALMRDALLRARAAEQQHRRSDEAPVILTVSGSVVRVADPSLATPVPQSLKTDVPIPEPPTIPAVRRDTPSEAPFSSTPQETIVESTLSTGRPRTATRMSVAEGKRHTAIIFVASASFASLVTIGAWVVVGRSSKGHQEQQQANDRYSAVTGRSSPVAPSPDARKTSEFVTPRLEAADPRVTIQSPGVLDSATGRSDAAVMTRGAGAGFLRIVVIPWGEVEIDGTVTRTGPTRRIGLASGMHTIKVSHPDYRTLQRKVSIKTNETTVLTIDLSDDAIKR